MILLFESERIVKKPAGGATAGRSRLGLQADRGLGVEEESGRLARTFAHFPRLHHRLLANTQSRQMLLNITPRVTVSTSKHI
jgi:hypothetical protein